MASKIPFRRRTVLFGIALVTLVGVAGFAGYSLRPHIATPTPTQNPKPTQPLPSALPPRPVDPPTAFEPSAHTAQLANDRCEEEFGVRPFQADTFKLTLDDDRYIWGRLDPIGVKGYSAKVSFNREGRDASVSVYWSGVDRDPDGFDLDGGTLMGGAQQMKKR